VITKGLLKSSVAFTIGGALPMLGSLILVPVYIKYYTPAQYGELTLLITLTILFQAFISFGLDNYLGVQIHFDRQNPEKQRKLIVNVFALQFLVGIGLVLFMLLLGDQVLNLFFTKGQVHFFWSGLLCVLTAWTACVYRTYQNLQINLKQVRPYVLQSMAFTVVNVVCSLAGLYYLENNIDGPLLGRLVAGSSAALLMIFLGLKIKWSEIDLKLEGWFRFTWPVLLMAMNAWIVSYSSPYILNYFVDKNQVGLYSFVLTLLIVLDFFHNGLTSSLLPSIFEERVKHGRIPEKEKGVHHFYSMINVLAMGGALLGLPIIIPVIVSKPEYLEATVWLLLFTAGYAWKGVYFSAYSTVMFEKNSRALMWNGIFSTWAQVLTIIALSSLFGLEGALIGTALGKMIQAYGLFFRSGAHRKLHLNITKVHLMPFIYCLFLVGLFYSPLELSTLQLGVIAFGLSLLLIGLVYRKEIPQVTAAVRERLVRNRVE
jgi:O-antigen/teichoic acid export membrane protein